MRLIRKAYLIYNTGGKRELSIFSYPDILSMASISFEGAHDFQVTGGNFGTVIVGGGTVNIGGESQMNPRDSSGVGNDPGIKPPGHRSRNRASRDTPRATSTRASDPQRSSVLPCSSITSVDSTWFWDHSSNRESTTPIAGDHASTTSVSSNSVPPTPPPTANSQGTFDAPSPLNCLGLHGLPSPNLVQSAGSTVTTPLFHTADSLRGYSDVRPFSITYGEPASNNFPGVQRVAQSRSATHSREMAFHPLPGPQIQPAVPPGDPDEYQRLNAYLYQQSRDVYSPAVPLTSMAPPTSQRFYPSHTPPAVHGQRTAPGVASRANISTPTPQTRATYSNYRSRPLPPLPNAQPFVNHNPRVPYAHAANFKYHNGGRLSEASHSPMQHTQHYDRDFLTSGLIYTTAGTPINNFNNVNM